MSNLTRFDHNGIELFIDMQTGECFASQNALARMTGKSKSVISDWAKGVRNDNRKMAEVLTNGGIQGVRLLNESAILQCFVTYKPELILKFAQAGLRVYLHHLAGFTFDVKQQSQQPKLPPNKEALEVSRDVREITDNLVDNPRLAQLLIDHAISGIVEKQLIDTPLRGVVEIAEEMGHKATSCRSMLGKFVKAQCSELARREKRLVNGTMREVYCYPDVEEVRDAIALFFR